jgi:DeoR/GlpR family transcriptional regulator of sugar metabolism
MDVDERRKRILADVKEDGDDLMPRLSKKYGVSEMTIRRDLKSLERAGLVVRTYGGATLTVQSENSAWQQRREKNQPQKQAIARHAASLVTEGDVIILDGSTTVAAMVPFLRGKRRLTLVTNGLHIVSDLAQHVASQASVICPGGMLHSETATFIGPVTNRFFREFHSYRLFVSAVGFTIETGATDTEMLVAETKHTMIQSAAEVILLLDSSKFGVKSLMKLLSVEEINQLITDEAAPTAGVDDLRSRGVSVTLVPTELP